MGLEQHSSSPTVEFEEKLMNVLCFCENTGSLGHLRGIIYAQKMINVVKLLDFLN